MLDFSRYKFWLCRPEPTSYGPEAIEEVGRHSQTMVQALNEDKSIPFEIVFKPVLTTPEDIWRLVAEANASEECAGLITWMHTFSPAKMWIGGFQSSESLSSPAHPVQPGHPLGTSTWTL